MNWQAILQRAARASEAAHASVQPIIELFERGLSSGYSEADVAKVFDPHMFRVPFMLELERAALAPGRETWPPEQAAATRAVFSSLLSILHDLRTISAGTLIPADKLALALEQMVAISQNDVAAEAAARQRWQPGNPVCPRCGSVRVATQHTGALGERMSEARCEACHHYTGWAASEGQEHPWSRS